MDNYVSQEDMFYYYYQKYFNKNNHKNEYDFIIEEIQKIENAENEYKYLCSLDEKVIFEKIKKDDYRGFKKEDFNQLSNEVIKNVIRSFLNHKYVQLRNISGINKNYLQYKLKHFESIYKLKIDRIHDNNRVKNQYEDIFKGDDNANFLIFKTYAEKHIIDFYADYSFLFQKMKSKTENRLHNVKHLDFMMWLKNHNYISEKVYDDFIKKGTFSKKYNSAQRENNYNNILNDLLK